MNITPIASSSKGNAYLISDEKTTILLECGLPLKELKHRTKYVVPAKIDACFVSHCHNDHSKCLKDLLNAGVQCYALNHTFAAKGIMDHRKAKVIKPYSPYYVNTMLIIPLEMNHDVPCVGFFVSSRETGERLLFATDTYMIKDAPVELTHIMIEANYDVDLVEDDALKNRLFKSHMSIDSTVHYLKSIDLSSVKKIYLLHLSNRHSNEADFKKRVQAATGKIVEVCDE